MWSICFLLNSGRQTNPVLNSALYNFGRVTTYVVFGLLFGLLGLLFNLSGVQEYVSLFSGILFLLLGFIQLYSGKNLAENAYLFRFTASLKQKLGTQLKSKSVLSGYFLGLLNGLLPCGMVYMALIGSLGMASFAGSGLYMLFFGLGTIPLMFLATYGVNFFSPKWKKYIQKSAPYVLLILGILFLLRGLGYVPLNALFNIAFQQKDIPICH